MAGINIFYFFATFNLQTCNKIFLIEKKIIGIFSSLDQDDYFMYLKKHIQKLSTVTDV